MTRDVYATSAELELAGVRFQKRPDEGRMKGRSVLRPGPRRLLDRDRVAVGGVRRDQQVHFRTNYEACEGPRQVAALLLRAAWYDSDPRVAPRGGYRLGLFQLLPGAPLQRAD